MQIFVPIAVFIVLSFLYLNLLYLNITKKSDLSVIPGDKNILAEIQKQLEEKHELNDSEIRVYFRFISSFMFFKFGPSFKYHDFSAGELISHRLFHSIVVYSVILILYLALYFIKFKTIHNKILPMIIFVTTILLLIFMLFIPSNLNTKIILYFIFLSVFYFHVLFYRQRIKINITNPEALTYFKKTESAIRFL